MKEMTLEEQMSCDGGRANWRTNLWLAGEVICVGAVIYGTGGVGALAIGAVCGGNALFSML